MIYTKYSIYNSYNPIDKNEYYQFISFTDQITLIQKISALED